MKTIVFTAQAFGFGPVRKMLAISENLSGVKKIFFGSSVAYDLAMTCYFDEYHYLEHKCQEEILSLLSRADIFVNVMDFALSDFIEKSNCYYIIIDSLLWFYPFRPNVDRANIYFCQDFFYPIADKIKQHEIKNAQVIGAIIEDHIPGIHKKNQCIINFGGCDGRVDNSYIEVGKNSYYPLIILKLLLPIVSELFDSVLVVGRKNVTDMCKQNFNHQNVIFTMLHFKEMFYELAQSEIMFSVAGIQSFFDGHSIPIFFLPEHNHSHHENLKIYIDKKITTTYFSWQECYGLELNNNMNRNEKIALVLEKISLFANDIKAQELFVKQVNKVLKEKNKWHGIVDAQKKAMRSIGDNGLEKVTDAINNIVGAKHEINIKQISM